MANARRRSAAGASDDALRRFLAGCARRYCWDMDEGKAAARPDRVITRIMDLGAWEDILDLERLAGARRLAKTLEGASHGALRDRSWSFWHYRLGIIGVGEEPPPQPARIAG